MNLGGWTLSTSGLKSGGSGFSSRTLALKSFALNVVVPAVSLITPQKRR